MIELKIDYTPKPQKRHRDRKFGKYDPSSRDKAEFRLLVRAELDKIEDIPILWNAYSIEYEFAFEIPKSWPKRKKENPPLMTKRPDLSNLIKFIEDALNGVIWRDDSAIVESKEVKRYDKSSHIVMRIKEVK